MADREPIDFITVNHQHIPIFEGESKQDAYNKAVARHNEDVKSKQIAKNKEEADRLNDKKQNKSNNQHKQNSNNNDGKEVATSKQDGKAPKTLKLNNIKSKDANNTSDVLNLRTKQRFKFKDGTEVQNVYVFAGKGCSKEFRDAEKYANRYKKLNIGKAEEWQHCAGKAVITDGKKDLVREVHWVQGNDGKIREAFIKEYPKKLEKRK